MKPAPAGPAPIARSVPGLDDLGERICILGPSNSGKSTLAAAIERRRGLPAVHLDVLFHEPDTDWHPRPEAEFLRLHGLAIRQPRWVMEGNYTRCLDERLRRATGFILLDTSTATSLVRYFRRTWFERHRAGALPGSRDSVKWTMVRHIAVVTPPRRRAHAELFEDIALPKVRLATSDALARFYRAEELDREASNIGSR
jgi:adenylate kinase family enzyme